MNNKKIFEKLINQLITDPYFDIYTRNGLEYILNKQNTDGKITDIDGNEYRTVIIGEQEWMQENLRTTMFNDGNDIPHLTDSNWGTTSLPAFSWYNNSSKNNDIYGALYNWHSVETGKLCPSGWVVPSDDDWNVLIEYLGGKKKAGSKLKIADKNYWNKIKPNETDEYEFSAFPGGYRYGHYWSSAEFIDKGINGYWWTSTEYTDTHAWSRTIHSRNSRVYRSYFEKNDGFSIRCIKNF